MLHRSVGLLVISLVLWWGATHAEVFEECGDKKSLYLAVSESCSKYIYCDGEDSFMGDCEKETPYFSETDQTCDTDQVVCKQTGGSSNSGDGNPVTPSTTKTPESGLTTTGSSITTTTTINSELITTTPVSTTPVPTTSVSITPISTTLAPTTPVSTSDSTTPVSTTSDSTTKTIPITSSTTSPATSSGTVPTSTDATTATSQCPATDDPNEIVFLPHSTSCSNYFMCYHGVSMPMHCSNMLYFDPISQTCDYPENVKCQLNTATAREKCQAHTVDVYPYPANCNYYYLCRFGYLMVMQCPLNMDWDYEEKACRLRGSAKCYHPTVDGIIM